MQICIGPAIVECIGRNFQNIPNDFINKMTNPGDWNNASETLNPRLDYFKSIGKVRFALGLPGIGYDCYRFIYLFTVIFVHFFFYSFRFLAFFQKLGSSFYGDAVSN